MIKYEFKDTFAVVGKAGQGFVQNFDEWTEPLWDTLLNDISEIADIVRTNKNGKPLFWSALSDCNGSFERWGEQGFSDEGRYMAACEADVDINAPSGWDKWVIPAQTYMVFRSSPTESGEIYTDIVKKYGTKIIGVGHAFFPEYGNDNLVDTYIPVAAGMIHCQSCGMPMTEESHFGKNTDGSKNEDYCCHCYPAGAFTNPNETMDEMIESCIPFMVEDGVHAKDEESARALLTEFLPTLKRWKTN